MAALNALRVGVLAAPGAITSGGWWTLPTALTLALQRAQTRHEFIFLDEMVNGGAGGASNSEISFEASSTPLRSVVAAGLGMARSLIPLQLRRSVAKHRGRDYESRLAAAIDRQRPDIIWFLTPHGTPLRVPYIATVWDLEHRKQPYFPEVNMTGWNWLDREQRYQALLPRASIIIAGTQAGKQEIVNFYRVDPNNVKVVPFPIPDGELRQTNVDIRSLRMKYGIDGPFLFYPAQFWPHKNHVNLLLALAILRKRNGLRLNLVFTGSDKGNRPYVREKIKTLELADQVFDLGFVAREELNALYMNAVALVYPSFFGPDNLPPLEAYSFGCPVLASRIPGAEEQLGDGALLFDPTDPIDIADKIFVVNSDAVLRQRLIDGAKPFLAQTPERYVAQVEDILDCFAAVRRCWGSDYHDE